MTLVLGDGLGEDLVVDPERCGHGLRVGGPQPGGADHVGEEEGHGPRGDPELLARHAVNLAEAELVAQGMAQVPTGGTLPKITTDPEW